MKESHDTGNHELLATVVRVAAGSRLGRAVLFGGAVGYIARALTEPKIQAKKRAARPRPSQSAMRLTMCPPAAPSRDTDVVTAANGAALPFDWP